MGVLGRGKRPASQPDRARADETSGGFGTGSWHRTLESMRIAWHVRPPTGFTGNVGDDDEMPPLSSDFRYEICHCERLIDFPIDAAGEYFKCLFPSIFDLRLSEQGQ